MSIGIRRALKIASVAAVCGASSLIAAPAEAVTTITVTNVQATGLNYTVGIQNPTTLQYEYAYDTALIFTINGHQVLVNCDDLWHNIYLGAQNLTFTLAPFSGETQVPNPSGGYYSASQIGQMSWLIDEADKIWTGAQAPVSGNVEQNLAALQLASWMVGNPTTNYLPSSSVVAGLAAGYVSNSAGKGPLTGSYVGQFLSTNGTQAQIFDPVLTPVPEPAVWAMLLFGFGGIGFALRAARQQSKVLAA